ncbi:MAG: GNAT family N-acetyltransferase [Dehalococcoidia bacterium]
MPVKELIAVRPAETDDREAIQELWEAAGLSPAANDEWEALTSGATTAVLVAEDDLGIVGAAIAAFDGWRAYVYHVAVAERARRQGVAYDLMGNAEQYLLSAGARHVYVMVNDENTEGLALVGSSGYLPEGDLVLVKRLASRP